MISINLPSSGGGSLERWVTPFESIQWCSRSADPVWYQENMAITSIRNMDNIFIMDFLAANRLLIDSHY
jgi:hypothetical protein